ncbi:MAG: hypothetical protein ALECFALPRED_004576 [Alectoria fallacina]|uniref:Uncharacterized protein n=1 Tax=Alectoria fallacina TaxID=1903189 RepID=A0A8H3FT69_9LECA|nr:MAG: hypothetical protein ALECFALPRED_004576 [Alectoria fallacina]
MSSSASSNSTQIITNVVFGITATVISIVTVWQGHRVWKMGREYAHGQENVAPGIDQHVHVQKSPITHSHRVDVELGLQSSRSTPTSLEAPDREEFVAASAPSPNQFGGVAESDNTYVSVQRPELQPILPTTVDAETSLGPALVQGARSNSNEIPGVHTESAQSALTDMERRELRPVADDHP